VSWRTYLRLGRVSNLPTVWTNALAGAVLGGGTLSAGRLALPLVALSLLYTGGMYLNDAFDREIDARERPERPIPSGAVGARQVLALGFGMLAAAMLALGVHVRLWPEASAWTLASGGALGVAVLVYDLHHKGNPWSPVLMGLTRGLVYVTAALATAARPDGAAYAGAAVLLAYVVGLTYAAKQETLGRVGTLWPLLFVAAPFLYALRAVLRSPSGAALYAGFLAWVALALALLIRPGRADVPRAVVSLIAGISLLDAVLIAQQGEAMLAWGAVAGFGAALFLQRYVRGT
jgi:hypothetical protein